MIDVLCSFIGFFLNVNTNEYQLSVITVITYTYRVVVMPFCFRVLVIPGFIAISVIRNTNTALAYCLLINGYTLHSLMIMVRSLLSSLSHQFIIQSSIQLDYVVSIILDLNNMNSALSGQLRPLYSNHIRMAYLVCLIYTIQLVPANIRIHCFTYRSFHNRLNTMTVVT